MTVIAHFLESGRWTRVEEGCSFEGCCDCGLVHKIQYRVRKGKIEYRAWRAPTLTQEARKKYKHKFKHA